ncbi:MAG: hypothetical protein ABSH20_29205 [Tepidisphaeraceae bacterium]
MRGRLSSHSIDLWDDAIETYLRRCQTMRAAHHQDPRPLATEYAVAFDACLV